MSGEPPELRASHADRDQAVDVLRLAAGDGRLSTDELETRVEAALSARTIGELASLTSDLPAAKQAEEVLHINQRFGRFERTGRWTVPRRIAFGTHFCRVILDFTEAEITHSTLHIDIDAQGGKLVLVTKPGIVVDTTELNVEFGKIKVRPPVDSGIPLLVRIELVGAARHIRVVEQFVTSEVARRARRT
ncbi:uncharacterized protein DUF1707 [Streptomyces sp. 1114.5]|uniref:DUF1707 SHOCT-like domain-containing protein n=1 Tax=unclassified Streptomyces TaxID=2593676 RepID=UPI000BD54246|nr:MULTISPECIES: DUF1707 domain-containing protein [unclassified Streptomyces]RKT18985.1 uncharacterized protein DUF1707 [Streptomyces sp. 1114.5]SOB85184.1 protein of unknown function [Streptomyces sp. 1331.2]